MRGGHPSGRRACGPPRIFLARSPRALRGQVGYDRNSAQRTRVLDDQSDFFEVDANAWLTREVLAHTGPAT